jgi:ribosomal protein S18 acetylase RimI-like enzyme
MQERVSLRPASESDREFLYRVYASTRREELAVTGWTDAETSAFLRMQFDLQDRYYRHAYAGARFDVILSDGEPIGRLYVDRREREVSIVDIALLPEHRGRGIGRSLLDAILTESGRAGTPVCIQVERSNPALRLYERLGFRVVDEDPVRFRMEKPPPASPARDQ